MFRLLGAADASTAFRAGMRVLFQGIRSLTAIGRTADRGISGNTLADLAKRWQTDTLALEPDLLSILIGVNETSRGVPAEEFEKAYHELLAGTVAARPNIRFVLGEPFTEPGGRHKEDFAAWRAEIRKRQDAVARLAAKYHAVLVRYQQAFDRACERAPADYWIWDAIHPTYAGHQIMADAWEAAVAAGLR